MPELLFSPEDLPNAISAFMDMANPPDSGTSSSTSDEDSFPSLVEAATSPSESSEASSWETASSSSERSDEDSMPELADATSSSSESDGGAVYPAGLRRRRPRTSYVERRRSASEASEAGSGEGAAPRDPLERYMAAVHRVRREHMLATAEMPSDSDAAHASDDERDRADAAYEERQALMCFEFAVCALRRSLRFTYSMPQVRRRQRLPAMEAG